jgi:clan AA aspartic protease
MGLIFADLRLANPARPELAELDAKALADTGALHLCIPEHVATQLQLPRSDRREVTTADGKSHVVDYVGPVRVELFGRQCFTGALVLGNEVLLGAIPMEDMDLVVDPARQRIMPNPTSPNIPQSTAK